MGISIHENHFATEEEARDEIAANGLWAFTADFPADKNGAHWHDFDAHVYVLEGTLKLSDPTDGTTCECNAGTKMIVSARTLHARGTRRLQSRPRSLRRPGNPQPAHQPAARTAMTAALTPQCGRWT